MISVKKQTTKKNKRQKTPVPASFFFPSFFFLIKKNLIWHQVKNFQNTYFEVSQTNLRLIFKNKTKHWAWNWKLGFYPHLDKKWNGVEPSDDDSVVHISGQDVQSSCATFHYFLHAHTLLYDSSFHEMKGRKGEKKNTTTFLMFR